VRLALRRWLREEAPWVELLMLAVALGAAVSLFAGCATGPARVSVCEGSCDEPRDPPAYRCPEIVCPPCAPSPPTPLRPPPPPRPPGLLIGTVAGCPEQFVACYSVADEVQLARYLDALESRCGGRR
jgi:hypothetical protein